MRRSLRFVWSALAGGLVSLSAMVLFVLGVGFPKNLNDTLVGTAVVTFVIGSFGGALIEFFVARISEAAASLQYSVETQSTVSAATAAFCALWLKHQKHIDLDTTNPVRRWALISLLEHLTVISAPAPSRARETYCQYLFEALQVAGSDSAWLGIHQTGVNFFTDSKYRNESGAYVFALRKHNGPKYRIFVENASNTKDFSNRDLMRRYLKSDGAVGVASFRISRAAFDRLVEPRGGSPVGDWALYGEEIVLEYDSERTAIVFHLNDVATEGMKRLLHAIRSPEPPLGIERIDERFVAGIKGPTSAARRR